MKPWERAARAAGGAEVVEALAALPSAELTALLLEVSARRQGRLAPAEVARRYAQDAFVAPCAVDQRTFVALDAHLLARAEAFEAVELSPVAPLGAVTALAAVHPNNVLPTFRHTEVLSDCTNVLALECARRRARGEEVVRLCTSHRMLRAQRVKEAFHTQHFRLFALVTAGRDRGGRSFQAEALLEHLRVWIDQLRHLPEPFSAEPVGLVLACDERHEELAERVSREVPLPVRRDTERLRATRYYQGLAYKLLVRAPDGRVLPLGDGGFVDWLGHLSSDRKERLLVGAIGTEALAKVFRRA